KLLDEREDVTVILSIEKLFQMIRTLCPNSLLFLNHCARRCEIAVYLTIQILSICHDEECPVPGELPQDLLRKEDHRIALAGAFRVAKDAQFPLVGLDLLGCEDRLVHSKKLMVLCYEFCRFTFCFKQREVLDNVQKASRLTNAPNHSL